MFICLFVFSNYFHIFIFIFFGKLEIPHYETFDKAIRNSFYRMANIRKCAISPLFQVKHRVKFFIFKK